MVPEIRPIKPGDAAGGVGLGLEAFRPMFASIRENYVEDLFNALRLTGNSTVLYIGEAYTDDDRDTGGLHRRSRDSF